MYMKRHACTLRAGDFRGTNTPDKRPRNVRLHQKIAQISKMPSKVGIRPSNMLFTYDSGTAKKVDIVVQGFRLDAAQELIHALVSGVK